MFNLFKKRLLIFSIMLFLFIIPLVTAYHRYYHFYDTSGPLDIIGLYENNFQFIDFILYLVLIGGASKVVFQRRFGATSGAGLLTIGLSGLISGALVWWEAQRGESVIMIVGNAAGSWFLWILGILFVLALYAFLRTFYGAWRSMLIVLGLAIIAIIGLGVELPDIPGVPTTSSDLLGLLFYIIMIIGLIFLFRWTGRRVRTHIATPNIPTQEMSSEEREILRQQGRRTAAEASLLEAQRGTLLQQMQQPGIPPELAAQLSNFSGRIVELERLLKEGRISPQEAEKRRINYGKIQKEILTRLQEHKALPAPNLFTGSRLTDPRQRTAFLIRTKDQFISKYGRREGMRRYIIFFNRFQKQAKR